MLRFYHQLSYGFITGVLLGSVFSLWPWQQVVSSYLDSEGRPLPLQTINVLPLNYAEITGNDPMLMLTALSFLVGITVVMLLRWIAYPLILQK
jgi:putative membrane protein